MTKETKKYSVLTEEDVKIIESDPTGLADYVVRTKVKETRKTALIVALIAIAISFGAGAFVGMSWTKSSIPNNVVQIQVGSDGQVGATTEPTPEQGK